MATILEDPSVIFEAPTKVLAERGILDLYRKSRARKINPPTPRVIRIGPVSAELEWDPGTRSFSSYCPELEVASCGDTESEAIEMLKEAMIGHIRTSRDLGLRIRISPAKQRELERVID